jgi:hypothetical protein
MNEYIKKTLRHSFERRGVKKNATLKMQDNMH